MLNRWYQVKEDLLFAFEKISQSNIKEPSKTILSEFVIRVRGGLDTAAAIKMMSDSYDDPTFRYVLKQLEFNLKYRGNIGELLDDLESQLMKEDEEFTKRRISTSKDRKLIRGIFFIEPILMIMIISTNVSAREFYAHTKFGEITLVITSIFYILGILLYMTAGRKSKND